MVGWETGRRGGGDGGRERARREALLGSPGAVLCCVTLCCVVMCCVVLCSALLCMCMCMGMGMGKGMGMGMGICMGKGMGGGGGRWIEGGEWLVCRR